MMRNWAFCKDAALYVTDAHGEIAIHDDCGQLQTTTAKNANLLALQKDLARRSNAEQVRWLIQLRSDQQRISDLSFPIMGNLWLGPLPSLIS